jgi:hypothetical protein
MSPRHERCVHVTTARMMLLRRNSMEMKQHKPAYPQRTKQRRQHWRAVKCAAPLAGPLGGGAPESRADVILGQSVDSMTRKREEAYNVCKTLRHSLEKGCSGSDRGALRACNKDVIGVFNVRVAEAAGRPQGGLSVARSIEPAGSRSFPLKGVDQRQPAE